MAQEQDNYKINFDTNAKQAANDTNALGEALDNVDKSTKQLNTSNKSLRAQIKEATIELIQAQQKFGDYSKEALAAAKNVAELKDRIAEASETANLFDPGAKFQAVSGAISAMASGFAVAQGAMGLFGAESKEVEQTLLKVQSAMALSQGLSTIADSAKDFQRLKAIVVDAMKSIATAKTADTIATETNTTAQGVNVIAVTADTTAKSGATIATTALTVATNLLNASMAVLTAPITLVVAAIGGLVAGIGYLTGAFGDFSGEAAAAEKANRKLNAEIDNLARSAEKSNKELERNNKYIYDMAKASGASSAELRKLSEQLINNEVAEKRLNAVKAQSIFLEARRIAGLEDATDAQKETAKKAYELFKEQNKIYNDSLDARKDLALKNRVEVQQEETDAENKRLEAQKKSAEKRLEAQKEANRKRLEEEKRAAEERRKEELAQYRRAEEEYDKALKIHKEARIANENSQLSDNEIKVNAENEQYQKKLETLQKFNLDTTEVEAEHKRRMAELNDEFFAAEADKAIEKTKADKERNDEEIAAEEAKSQHKKELQDKEFALADKGLAFLSQMFGKSKAVQKGIIIAEGAVSIGKQVSSNNAANIGALATPQAIATSGAAAAPVIALNNISTAIGIASTIAATSKALSSLGGGGSAGSAPSMNAPQVGSAPPQVAFNNTAENQIGQSVARVQAEQPPLQVNVLESDITTAQNNVSNLVNVNTF